MKILIVHKAMVVGGVERNLLSYTSIFNELDYQVDCLFTYDLSNSEEQLQAELKQLFARLHFVLSPKQSDFMLISQKQKKISLFAKLNYECCRFILNYKQKKALLNLISIKQFDLILDFSGVLDKLKLKIAIPIIRWFQSETDFQHFLKNPQRFEKYTKIVTLTKAVSNKLNDFQPYNRDKFIVIYNPINHQEIDEKLIEKIELEDKDYFLTVSRLVDGKGLFELIDIYAELKIRGIKNKLYIVGDGELKNTLQDRINELGLINECILLGNKINPYPYFKNAKLFLFTSENEGFGIVILESMSCAVPVVVMDCPTGPREILGTENQYGKLIPLHDKKQFCEAILELLNDDKCYRDYQQKSYERSLDFSVEKSKQAISELFTSIWNSKV